MKDQLTAGYLESWGKITFTEAVEAGYDTIIMAFGKVEENEVGVFADVFFSSPSDEAFREDIKMAKRKGAKHILFSVGGELNTFNPDAASPSSVAAALVAYMNDYGFTGIDFKLEVGEDIVTEEYLDELCAKIKEMDHTKLITAAPQLNQLGHSSDLLLVSTGYTQLYNTAINNNRIDYLFIQAYNNPWPAIDGYSQTNVEFISEAFYNLQKTIPASTKIVIGEPASKTAANISMFTSPYTPNKIYELIRKEYQLIQYKKQYGGAVVWNINNDQENGYAFVGAMKQSQIRNSNWLIPSLGGGVKPYERT